MFSKEITPRRYQEVIFHTAVQKNCLVVLPTGLGKTMIAAMLAAQRLQQYPESKVIILAPTKPLVQQHFTSFQKVLDIEADDFAFFTGTISPKKRAEQFEQARVIFSTPQGLENDVLSNSIKLDNVSLMVFEEL